MNTAQEVAAMKSKAKTKIIKRYQNRKLYDTQQSCYVTLDDIARMVRNSEDVIVLDNKSKSDITAATMIQIIFESEKKASQYPPLGTLRDIIQHSNGTLTHFLAKLNVFPAEYLTTVAQPVVTATDSLRQALETRVAKAAVESSDPAKQAQEDETMLLPRSAKIVGP